MLSVPKFTPSAQTILNGGGGGGTTDTNPIPGSVVVYTDTTGDRGTPTTTVTSTQAINVTAAAQTSPFNILTLQASNTTRNYIRLINSSGTSDGNGISFSPLTGAGDWEIGNDTNMNGTDNFYIFSATAATQVQTWTPTLITANRTLQVNAGLTLATTATNPGGASTLWWTTPSIRPNFGANGPLALLSDVTSGSVVVTTATVNLTAPTSSPFMAAPPAGSTLTLTKYATGTSIKVVGEFSSILNLPVVTDSPTASVHLIYPAATIPAAFIPTAPQSVPVAVQHQGMTFMSSAQIGTGGSIDLPPANSYDSVGLTVVITPWGLPLAPNGGIYPCNFIYTFSP